MFANLTRKRVPQSERFALLALRGREIEGGDGREVACSCRQACETTRYRPNVTYKVKIIVVVN